MKERSLFIRTVVSLIALSMLSVFGVPSIAGAVDGTNTVSTLAGTGSTGDGVDGLAGPLTALSGPGDVAAAKDGTIYIADTINHKVRKVGTDGIVTTFAGTGTPGDTGDGSPATAATLTAPGSVAVDKNGLVYIADTGNNKIRVVASDGTISTLAGTGTAGDTGDGAVATTATLDAPAAVAVSKTGLVYVADANHRVRVISTDGFINAFAGTGTLGDTGDGAVAVDATFDVIADLAVDKNGVVYIADVINDRVRKVALDGTITAFAGTGTAGNTGDGAAATAAQVEEPAGVAVDTGLNVYIASSSRIRRVAANGTISTIAGAGGSYADDGPAADTTVGPLMGMDTDKHGTLFFVDSSSRVRMITQPDVINPVVTITSPVDASTVAADSVLVADFECSDFYSGIDTCLATLDGVAILDGATVDTSSAGDQILSVTGLDLAGNTLTVTSTVTVSAVPDTTDPVVTITSPADGAEFDLDAVVAADFACTDPGGGIDTCLATFDGVAILDGANLDTAVAGEKSFSVTGLDLSGNSTTVTSTVTIAEASEVDIRIITGAYAGSSGDTAVVARLYVALLKRQPETAGHEYWMGQIASGVNHGEIAAFFVVSPEWQLVYGDTTDEEFVDLLYQNVMHRVGETEGRTYWIDQLGDKTPRLAVALFFSQSDEFKIHTQTS